MKIGSDPSYDTNDRNLRISNLKSMLYTETVLDENHCSRKLFVSACCEREDTKRSAKVIYRSVHLQGRRSGSSSIRGREREQTR